MYLTEKVNCITIKNYPSFVNLFVSGVLDNVLQGEKLVVDDISSDYVIRENNAKKRRKSIFEKTNF